MWRKIGTQFALLPLLPAALLKFNLTVICHWCHSTDYCLFATLNNHFLSPLTWNCVVSGAPYHSLLFIECCSIDVTFEPFFANRPPASVRVSAWLHSVLHHFALDTQWFQNAVTHQLIASFSVCHSNESLCVCRSIQSWLFGSHLVIYLVAITVTLSREHHTPFTIRSNSIVSLDRICRARRAVFTPICVRQLCVTRKVSIKQNIFHFSNGMQQRHCCCRDCLSQHDAIKFNNFDSDEAAAGAVHQTDVIVAVAAVFWNTKNTDNARR